MKDGVALEQRSFGSLVQALNWWHVGIELVLPIIKCGKSRGLHLQEVNVCNAYDAPEPSLELAPEMKDEATAGRVDEEGGGQKVQALHALNCCLPSAHPAGASDAAALSGIARSKYTLAQDTASSAQVSTIF